MLVPASAAVVLCVAQLTLAPAKNSSHQTIVRRSAWTTQQQQDWTAGEQLQ